MTAIALGQPTSMQPDLLPPVEVEAVYVHIPFCFHKCHYCDFYSITRQTTERMERFVELILAEADFWRDGRRGPTPRPRTIFFGGGGTPSLLPLEPMKRLLDGLRERFDLSQLSEWTVEANPATVQLEYCQMLRAGGVTRLSFGAQSFDPAALKTLERHHDPADVPRSIAVGRSAGFEQLNLDLIYAIPGQSLDAWHESLERAIALGTTHLSCYGLTYEPNTPMGVRNRLGQILSTDATEELAMLHGTRRRLEKAGLPSYEISNYAAPGRECQHNLIYWTGGNYIGLGPSAASHVEGHRWKSRPHLGEWETAIAQGKPPTAEIEHLSESQRRSELAMLMLRLRNGIEFNAFQRRFNCDPRVLFAATIARLSELRLIRLDSAAICLTEKGIDVADAVAAEFLE